MQQTTVHQPSYSVYPGEYVPLRNEDEVREDLHRSQAEQVINPAVNVTEFPDAFKVEVAIPGVKREHFLVQADDNVLSVCAVQGEAGSRNSESFQLHEFDYDCFDRHIILPQNVDVEFVSAEYREGILRFYLPKTNKPEKNNHTRIVVY